MPRDETYLIYMQTAAKRITSYIEGMSREQFDIDFKTKDSVALQLGNIGEAANQISKEFCENSKNIPWSKIVGMRHRIFHKYVEIDWDIVWIAATKEIPKLLKLLDPLIPTKNK